MTSRWLEGECGNETLLEGATPASGEFATYCLSCRAASLLSISHEWRRAAEAIVRYEDFLASPASASQQILRALNARPSVSIDEVIAANRIDKLRQIAPLHCWRGRSGDWRRVITPALANQIFARHRPCFDDFRYKCDPAPHLDDDTARRNWKQMVLGDEVSSLSAGREAGRPDCQKLLGLAGEGSLAL
jgi:hypothetical protein